MAKLVDEGIESAASVLDANRSATAFVYGDEWELYTFACAGRGIEPAMIERYLASVKANADVWSASLTDTERVMLTMAALYGLLDTLFVAFQGWVLRWKA